MCNLQKLIQGQDIFFSFQLFVCNFQKNPPLLKHILALLIVGQICIFQDFQPFEITTFYLCHFVRNIKKVKIVDLFYTIYTMKLVKLTQFISDHYG